MPYPKTSGQTWSDMVRQVGGTEAGRPVGYFALNRRGTLGPAAVLVFKLAATGQFKIG